MQVNLRGCSPFEGAAVLPLIPPSPPFRGTPPSREGGELKYSAKTSDGKNSTVSPVFPIGCLGGGGKGEGFIPFPPFLFCNEITQRVISLQEKKSPKKRRGVRVRCRGFLTFYFLVIKNPKG
jgi:hypothetical protein